MLQDCVDKLAGLLFIAVGQDLAAHAIFYPFQGLSQLNDLVRARVWINFADSNMSVCDLDHFCCCLVQLRVALDLISEDRREDRLVCCSFDALFVEETWQSFRAIHDELCLALVCNLYVNR